MSQSPGHIICYQGPCQPVVGLAGVVAYGVDHPAHQPDEPKGRGHLSVEQPGGQEEGQEDGNALQGVLVNSLQLSMIYRKLMMAKSWTELNSGLQIFMTH